MFALVIAFLSDLLIGDPAYAWHPVRLMGKAIDGGESFFRRTFWPERVAGAVLALMLPFLVFLFVWLLLFWAARMNPWLAWGIDLFGIYSAISIQDLRKEALLVHGDLRKNDKEKAQKDLARIVGRDTPALSDKEIVRACVETVAESTVDGVIAPLFYAALAGAPLALAYKAVNTLDSMIGHLDERYRDFGFVAARQDELWNWIPARLSLGLISLAAFFLKARPGQAIKTGWRDGMNVSHGNSAIPEAAFAGALGLRLGGESAYRGLRREKPFLGVAQKDFERDDIVQAVKLMLAASWISLIGSLFLKEVVTFAKVSFKL